MGKEHSKHPLVFCTQTCFLLIWGQDVPIWGHQTSSTVETKQVFYFSYLVLTAGVSALGCQYHQSHILACPYMTSNLEWNSWGSWLAGFTWGAVVPGYMIPQHTSASKQTPLFQPKHRMCPTAIAVCPGFSNSGLEPKKWVRVVVFLGTSAWQQSHLFH